MLGKSGIRLDITAITKWPCNMRYNAVNLMCFINTMLESK